VSFDERRWVSAFAGTTKVVSKPYRISIIVSMQTDEPGKRAGVL